MMKVIAFHGKKRSGKDTAANFLVDEGYQRIAFADALREVLYVLNPVIPLVEIMDHSVASLVALGLGDELSQARRTGVVRWQILWDKAGYDDMKFIPEVRRLMQVFGTEVGRQLLGNDIWVDIVRRKIAGSGINWAISDLRFENEARMVRSLGGHVIDVQRSNLEDDGDNHDSEAGIPAGLIDATLHNDGLNLDVYQRRVLDVVHTLTR